MSFKPVPLAKPPKEHMKYWTKWPHSMKHNGFTFFYDQKDKGVIEVPDDNSYIRFIANSWYQ